MIKDLVLDTHVLDEFIAQYFREKVFNGGEIVPNGKVTKERAKHLNKILKTYYYEGMLNNGMIITSAMSIIEIGRKFHEIAANKYNQIEFKSFIDELPPYVYIAPIDKGLSEFLCKVPRTVKDSESVKGIELADAIHCATYYSRDNAILFTDDTKINKISNIEIL